MKKILLASVLLTSLMLIAIPTGYAGNPPPPLPPGEQYGNEVGPDIHGTATFVELPNGAGVNITFEGWCKGNHFNYNLQFPVDFFDCVSRKWLLGTCCPYPCGCNGLPQQLTFPFPAACYPPNPKGRLNFNEYPVVSKVLHFTDNCSGVKTAEIIGKWLTIVPTK